MRFREFFIYSFCIGIVFLLLACTSTPPAMDSIPGEDVSDDSPIDLFQPEEIPPTDNRLVLTFGGDIMAHVENFGMADYNMIYTDIEEIIQNDDFTFANLETPVHEGRAYESYPTFNVQPEYVQAAIDAGFDVFSLANNHTKVFRRTVGIGQHKLTCLVYHGGAYLSC